MQRQKQKTKKQTVRKMQKKVKSKQTNTRTLLPVLCSQYVSTVQHFACFVCSFSPVSLLTELKKKQQQNKKKKKQIKHIFISMA